MIIGSDGVELGFGNLFEKGLPKSEIHEIHEIQSLSRTPLFN